MVDLHNPNVIGTMTGVDFAAGNQIAHGNSNVTVTDTGTGVITVSADGTQIFNGAAAAIRLGFAAGNRIDIAVAGETVIESSTGVRITDNGANVLFGEGDGVTVFTDLTVNGDLFVDGTTFVVNNEEVTTSDNIIIVNNGEAGAGVTAGSAGIQVDRGSATDYQFLFVESNDTFRIGEVGSLQAVATREDSPTDQAVPYWNDASKRYDTANARFKINGNAAELYFGAAKVAETTANGISGAVWG